MSDLDPGSPSALLRATHIIAIRIDSATPTPWGTNAAGWEERHIAIGAMLMRTLKGAVTEAPGTRFAARITQLRNPSPLAMPVPGAWTEIEVTAGAELLVLAATIVAVAPAAILLDDPACIRVAEPAEIPSAVLTLRYLRGELPALPFLTALKAARPGWLFVELLEELVQRPDFLAHEAFPQMLALMDDAALPADIRAGMITAVTNTPLPTDWHLDQLVIALLRVGLDPRSGEIADNILSIDMPSLVGLNGGEPRSATQVFHDEPTLRRQFLGLARAPGARQAAKKLIGWLSKD